MPSCRSHGRTGDGRSAPVCGQSYPIRGAARWPSWANGCSTPRRAVASLTASAAHASPNAPHASGSTAAQKAAALGGFSRFVSASSILPLWAKGSRSSQAVASAVGVRDAPGQQLEATLSPHACGERALQFLRSMLCILLHESCVVLRAASVSERCSGSCSKRHHSRRHSCPHCDLRRRSCRSRDMACLHCPLRRCCPGSRRRRH